MKTPFRYTLSRLAAITQKISIYTIIGSVPAMILSLILGMAGVLTASVSETLTGFAGMLFVLAFVIFLLSAFVLTYVTGLFQYTLRSMWLRKLTTILTVSGVSLVTFVFAAVLMLADGLEKTMIDTGSDDNVMVLRKAAQAEMQSQIDRDAANLVRTQPEIALMPDGKPLASTEVFVIINLTRKVTGEMGNITVRGVSPEAITLRPQVTLKEGRMFAFGSSEVVVGNSVHERFAGSQIGDQLKFGGRQWTVVGVMDGHGTGFSSEIWGDVEQVMPAFGRPIFSSMTFRLKDVNDFQAIKTRIESDRRTNYLELFREKAYYEKQSKALAIFIRVLGTVVTVIFSLGAMIGAMITMYAAVANRTVEIGTLRALGFLRQFILSPFLVESILISLIGAVVGVFAASFLQLLVISTVNFNTFAELAFGFTLTPPVILWTFVFALVMGIAGGFLPALRASRLNIVTALRAS